MVKILLTVLVVFLAVFIIYSKDISTALKIFLAICLVVIEVLVITKL